MGLTYEMNVFKMSQFRRKSPVRSIPRVRWCAGTRPVIMVRGKESERLKRGITTVRFENAIIHEYMRV